MSDKIIKTRLEADLSDYEEGLRRAGEATDRMESGTNRTAGSFGRLRDAVGETSPALGGLADAGRDVVDALGGSSDAAVALTRTLITAAPVMGTLAAAAGAVGIAFLVGDSESAKLRQSIALSGNAAGVTAGQLQEMANELGELTGAQGDVTDVLAKLTEGGKVAAGQLPEVTRAIVAMNDAGGAAVDDLVAKFERLRTEPTEGVLDLNESYNFLTPTIYEQIRALEAEGRTEEAAALAQKVSAEAVLQRANDVKAAAGIMEQAWNEVAKVATRAWNAMKSIGAASPLAEQIAQAEAEVARIRALGDDGTGFNDYELAQAETRLRALQKQAEGEARAAEEQARHNRELEQYRSLQDELLPLQEKGAEQSRTLAQALEAYRANIAALRALNPNSAMLDPAAIAAGEAAIRKQYETTKRTAAAAREAKDEYGALVDRLGGLSPNFRREWDLLTQAFEDGRMGAVGSAEAVGQLTAAQAVLLSQQQGVKRGLDEQTRATEAAAKAEASYLGSLEDKADAAERELENYGLTASAIERNIIARLEEERALLRGQEGQEDKIRALDREIEARQRLAAAIAGQEDRRAAEDAAEKVGEFWQGVYEDVGEALTQAVFDGGTEGWELVKKTIEATVVRAYVQPLVTQGVASVGNALGLGQAAPGSLGYANQAANGQPPLGTLGQLFGMTGTAFGSGFSAAASGQSVYAAQAAYADAGYGSVANGLGAGAGAYGALGVGYLGYQVGGNTGAVVGAGLGYAAGSGALGATAAAAVPYVGWVIAALAVLQQMGVFGGGTPHLGGAASADVGGGAALADRFNTPDFGLQWGAYRSDRSDEIDRMVVGLVSTAAGNLAGRAEAYGGDASGLRVTGKFAADGDSSQGGYRVTDADGNILFQRTKQYYDPETGAQKFGEDATRAEVAALQTLDLADSIEQLLDVVDPMTDSVDVLQQALAGADELARQLAVAEDLRSLGMRDAAEDARLAGLSAAAAWFESGEQIRAAATDGALSVDQMAQLAAQHYQNEVALLAALEAASGRVAGLFEDSARGIELAVLDDPGKYEYLRAEADQMLDVIASLMDPQEIEQYAQKLNQTVNQAFGLLDEGQQRQYADEFLSYLEGANDFVQERLQSLAEIVQEDQVSTVDVLAEAAAEQIRRAGEALEDGLRRAIDAIPEEIRVRVQVNQPASQAPTPTATVQLGDGP